MLKKYTILEKHERMSNMRQECDVFFYAILHSFCVFRSLTARMTQFQLVLFPLTFLCKIVLRSQLK